MDNNLFDKRTSGEWMQKEGAIYNEAGTTIARCNTTSRNMKDEEPEANAAFIVHACNNYESLLATLKRVTEALDGCSELANTSIYEKYIKEGEAAIQKASQ